MSLKEFFTDTLAARIAWRYLFARKSHSAVSVIAIVSVCGVALATMAIVCVLSVFNGFRSLVGDSESQIIPDLLVTPTRALIGNADSLAQEIAAVPGVAEASPVIQDNAVMYRGSRQLPVKMLGVDPVAFRRITRMDKMLIQDGKFLTSVGEEPAEADSGVDADADAEIIATGEYSEEAVFMEEGADVTDIELSEIPTPQAVISVGTAAQLGFSAALSPEELEAEECMLFLPRRTASSLNTSNPAASFMIETIDVVGVVETTQASFDPNTVIIDLSLARNLLEYDSQATEIYVKASATNPVTAEELARRLGDGYQVRDRLQQQSLHLRMISIEKWITFLLLSFILLIASFNVISTISMLIVDKRRDIVTLSRIGASRRTISKIFCWESAYVCAGGVVAGILLGVMLCLMQQQFGFIKLDGNIEDLIVSSYPVELRVTDILLVLIPGVLIALATAIVASRFAARQTADNGNVIM